MALDEPISVRRHPRLEIVEGRTLGAGPEDFRECAHARPHLPFEIVRVPGVLAPVIALSAKNMPAVALGN